MLFFYFLFLASLHPVSTHQWIRPIYIDQHHPTEITAEQNTFLKNVLMPYAVEAWQESLHPRSGGAPSTVTVPRQCAEHHIAECPEKMCKAPVANQTCGDWVNVPTEHLGSLDHCEANDGGIYSNCTTDPGGQGVSNASLIVYVTARNDSSCVPGSLNHRRSGVCGLDPLTDRPLAGYINVCPFALASQREDTFSDTPFAWRRQSLAMMYELGRVLGFEGSLLSRWRTRDGSPRTPRDACGDPPETVVEGRKVRLPSIDTLAIMPSYDGSVSKALVQTDTVRTVVRNMFACDSVEGAQLENQGDLLLESRWDQRLFRSELMSGGLSERHGEYLSNLTLAFFHDSGWYDANFSSRYAESPAWGWRAGCSFIDSPCVAVDYAGVPRTIGDPFCLSAGSPGCSDDHTSLSSCNLISHDAPILPRGFRYFSDTLKGGEVKSADYCPFYQPIEDGDCRYPSPNSPTGTVDARGHDSSRCVVSEPVVVAPGFSTSQSRRGMCVRTHCDKERRGLDISIKTGETVRCLYDGQRMSFPGHQGSILCPSYESMCDRRSYALSTDAYGNDTLSSYYVPPPRHTDSSRETDWNSHLPFVVLGFAFVCLVGLISYGSQSNNNGGDQSHDVDYDSSSSDDDEAPEEGAGSA